MFMDSTNISNHLRWGDPTCVPAMIFDSFLKVYTLWILTWDIKSNKQLLSYSYLFAQVDLVPWLEM